MSPAASSTASRLSTLCSRANRVTAHIGNYYVAPLSEKVALATYRVTMGLIITHRSSLWIFRDNRWQLFFHQGTVASLKAGEADPQKAAQIRYHVCYPHSMRSQLSTLILAFGLALPATHSLAAQTPSVDSRLATQNALFEELYQADLKESPERATAFGDYRYNDQLSDRSLAAIDRRHTADLAYLASPEGHPHRRFP